MGAILLLFKGFFGGLISKIFSDWRILVAIIVIVISGIIMLRIHKMEKNLAQAKEELVVERKNNDTLRGNVSTLVTTNKSNGVVIEQVTKDRDAAVKSVSALSNSIAETNRTVNSLKQKIDGLKTPPTPLTPYLVEAVEGIQQLRDQANPPVVTK